MAVVIGTKKIWDFWAPKYDRIWGFQKYSLRPTRSFVIRYILNLPIKPKKILDIGCGVGELSSEIAKNFPDVEITGADYSFGMISRAKQDFNHPNIKYIHGSLEHVLATSDKFDLIISTHSFPYFPDKKKAANEMKQLLSIGGRLIIIQGNTNNLYDYIWLALVQLGVSKAQFLSVYKVRDILTNVGFAVNNIKPVERAFFIPSIYMVEGINNRN